MNNNITRLPKNKVTKEILQYIVDNYGKISIQEIADNLGVNKRAVQDWSSVLRRAGIDLPHALCGSKSILKEFVREYLEKHPDKRKKYERKCNKREITIHSEQLG